MRATKIFRKRKCTYNKPTNFDPELVSIFGNTRRTNIVASLPNSDSRNGKLPNFLLIPTVEFGLNVLSFIRTTCRFNSVNITLMYPWDLT